MKPGFTLGYRQEAPLIVAGLLALLLITAACQAPAPLPTPTPAPVIGQADGQAGGQQAAPELVAARGLWKTSAHADSFVSGSDPNSECARCHSPQNWTPTDVADIPATCTSCKFKMPEAKPIAKADWKSIDCDICHRVEKGALDQHPAWLNTLVSQFQTGVDPYENVAAAGDLCQKCHTNLKTYHYKRDLGSGPHSTKQCTDCHNIHSLKASCTETCHSNVGKTADKTPGHDAAHAAVNCVACHDASGLKVGPVDGGKTWLTFSPTDAHGKPGPVPYVSHNLQKKVDCARCHAAGNAWGLKPDKTYTPGK